MSDVFIIKNQHDHYLGKSRDWVDGSETSKVYRSQYKDEAINSLFEAGSKDIELRGEILCVALNDKGQPDVEVLNPIPKEAVNSASEEEHNESEHAA